ncbi:MAG TPA: type IV secretion system DNA-binding domain-containing protein [Candidatus Paceibacterota bacterium]|nr:type IV secretion system DNA-binding domain-containing protein [Candidatus Paceibacterota bacterium]
MENPEQITYFADTDARNRRVRFGIKAKDRTRHVYVIGKTGMGKSTLLENMAVQDIRNGNGFAFIDPHGKTADLLLEYIPKERMKDVIYFAPFDMEYPVAFNVMEDVGYDKRHLVVSGLMSTFKKIWVDAWSARMEYILGNTLLALLEYPGATLLEVNRMLADKAFRNKVVANISDPSVKSFWVDEFAKYTDRFASEATPAIQNKIGQFTSNPLIRNIIGQAKSSFDLRKVMDDKKILIINLSKGRVGESNANLLGSMLITKIYLAALSRADIHERELQKLPNFYLYVDEFQSFANESFANILSEARKYKLNLTIAHQYIEQMSEEVRAAVFGNVGTLITFRVGSFDAEVLEKEFAPTFTAQDIVNLGAFQLYLRLMINGIGSQPFSASSMPPLEKPEISLVDEIIDLSRKTYSDKRQHVEDLIKNNLLSDEEKSKNNNPVFQKMNNGNNNNSNNDLNLANDKKQKQNNFKNNNTANTRSFIKDDKKQNNTKFSVDNKKTVIDQKIKNELLEEALKKDNSDLEQENVSLKQMTFFTKNNKKSQNVDQKQNNSLRDALADVLKSVNNNIPEKSPDNSLNKNPDKKSDNSFTKEFVEKKVDNVNKNDSQKKDEEDVKSFSAQQMADVQKTQQQNSQKEIPERELRKILGVE